MCSVRPDVQKQLAEAVTIISKYDFPENWDGLLLNLVAKLGSSDINVAKGVMLTANSIMKRFRYVFKSDSLYSELQFCLQGFQVPLLEKYKQNEHLIISTQNVQELTVLFETQRLINRVFFSLNWQDLPEFFEDNINNWMGEFAKYLAYKNPALENDEEDSEPGPIEKLKTAVLDNLNLYATKYEEEFDPFLKQFTQLVWQLLMEVGSQPKFDILATSAIKFLTTVSSKQMNVALFTEPVLRDIIQHIVVKNLTATTADEELFEDNPTDYIRKDMEGSDQDTRRRSACELVRSLLKFFSPKVSEICITYINSMLELYMVKKDWTAKDAALHLVLAVSVMSSSSVTGAGDLNPNVNIMSIFESHVLPEVQDSSVDARPIVKADAIKLICIFRSHLQVNFLVGLLPHIIRHLHSKYVVIQTYAALCIERFLTVKYRDPVSGLMKQGITKDHLSPFFQQLFTGLFTVLDNPELSENDHVMKCIMRMLTIVDKDIGSITQLVLNHLTKALERVCKNPINPYYNHYLFESLAVLIKSCVASADNEIAANSICDQFEALLFPPFQAVLAQDVVEFVPYVFQILAQLLALRPGKGISAPYKALFPPLLSPMLWERKGNVPALTDLFKAYINKGMAEIAAENQLTGMLGVFQKLLASKVNTAPFDFISTLAYYNRILYTHTQGTEAYSFILLNSIFSNNPIETLSPFLPTIFNLLLMRLQESSKESKVSKYSRCFLHSLCVFCISFPAQVLHDQLETITNGLVSMITLNIWEPNRDNCAAADKTEIRQMLIGGTHLLLQSALVTKQSVWGSLLNTLVALAEAASGGGTNLASDDFFLADDEEVGGKEFDSTYSRLAYAQIPTADSTAAIASAPAYFLTMLSQFCAASPGQNINAIQASIDPKFSNALQKLLADNNIRLI